MSQLYLFILVLISFTHGSPINDGEDVGEVLTINGQKVITGQTKYPYIVFIELMQINKGSKKVFHCTGVIIGPATVLTAAHCFNGISKLIVTVHAGVVDVNLERKKGQRIVMKDFVIHKQFSNECQVGKRCCPGVNDIAIIWLHKAFVFGPKVQRAKLNLNEQNKPESKIGWILGWGNNNKQSRMLQRGLMKVLTQQECEKFSQYWYIPQTFICLKSKPERNTGITGGDSGGPFIINGVVYGICSQTLETEVCNKTVDVYTDVARYNNWIRRNLRDGPPSERYLILRKFGQ